MKLARLHIEAGSMSVRRFGMWIPDGLHIWVGSRGVHLFWHRSPHASRIMLDILPPSNTPKSREGKGA